MSNVASLAIVPISVAHIQSCSLSTRQTSGPSLHTMWMPNAKRKLVYHISFIINQLSIVVWHRSSHSTYRTKTNSFYPLNWQAAPRQNRKDSYFSWGKIDVNSEIIFFISDSRKHQRPSVVFSASVLFSVCLFWIEIVTRRHFIVEWHFILFFQEPSARANELLRQFRLVDQ